MPQPWSAVEQSEEYQKLPQPQKEDAKQQYFDEVVSQKPEYQSMPKEDQAAAAGQFFGQLAPNLSDQDKTISPFEKHLTKGLYETVPFGKDIIKSMPGGDKIAQEIESTPQPKDIGEGAGEFVGKGLGYAPAFAGGSGLLKAAPMVGGALGVGAQEGTADLREGQTPTQAAVSGLTAAATTYAGGKALDAAGQVVSDALKPASQKISETIGDLYNKAIKPTIVKGNARMLANSQANVEKGVRAIIDNKDNLSLGDEGVQQPETLAHTSDAIAQTKDAIFNKYDAMQKEATGKGTTIDGLGLAQTLQPIIEDKALEVVSPQTKEYAVKLFDRLQSAGDMTPEEAQDMIKGFNGRLKAYYRNPSPDQYGNTAVDALVANNARKALDEAISQATSPGYQSLKNQYGALSSMEKDVSRAAQRSSNYQNKGLLDFSDIFTGEQVARGILTGNPAETVSGIGGRLIKEYYKRLNNPDSNIKNMFSKVSDLMQQEGKPSLVENISAATQRAKESLGGLFDAVPSRQLGMTGQAGAKSKLPVKPEIDPRLMQEEGQVNAKSYDENNPEMMDLWKRKGGTQIGNEEGTSNILPVATTAGATALMAKSAQAKQPIKDEDAIKTIIGEGESTGFQGMRALASAIRNRGTLQGAYGLNAPRVVNKQYSAKTERLARQAWEDSKKKDWSNGANHWFSDADLKKASVQKMIKGMQKLGYYRGNTFYKEGK